MTAPATYTATTFDATPKQVQEGIVSISGSITQGTTLWTSCDVIFLAKLPHGAKYVSSEFDHTTGGAGSSAFTISYGLAKGGPAGTATYSCFNAASNAGGILRKTVLGVPADVSCSDLDPIRYGILGAKIEAVTSPTAVSIINFTYCYRTDGGGG